MTAPQLRLWCPSVFEPMPTGDGLLARVKPPGGALSAEAARVLAEAAARWGNGVIELTSRASLQCRGLSAATAAAFASAAIRAGLAHPNPAVERRRNVIATPLAGRDPTVNPHAGPVASSLEALLAADDRLAALPPKFGFIVDGGGRLGLGPARADILVRLQDDCCEVRPDGARLAARVEPGVAAQAAIQLAHAFRTLGEDRRRMRKLVEEEGEETVFVRAGLSVAAPARRDVNGGREAGIGWLPYAGDIGAFGVGLPFGATDAATLAALAELAERFGDGSVLLTPWRALLVAGVAQGRLAALRTELAGLPVITDPEDRLMSLAACPGQPACSSATVPTRPLAAAIAASGKRISVHVAGCAKGCAHPGPAPVTLVGRDGRFDLIRDGRAGDMPVRTGLSPAEAMDLLA